MYRSTSKLRSILQRNIWALLAFVVPLILRSIPELLAWPYPIGNDTVSSISYLRVLLSGPLGFIHYHLVYSLETLTYWLTGNIFLVLNVFGPLLMGLVAFMMYLYSKRVLGWGNFKSFLPSLFVATYFIALRNSWDLYAESFALIFLFAALIFLKAYSSRWRYTAVFAFMILTALSHELVLAILFFILALEAGWFLIKGLKRDFVYLTTSLGLVFGLFIFTHTSQTTGIFSWPLTTIASGPSIGLSLNIIGFLLYSSALILPLVILGFGRIKDRLLKYWVLLCVAVPLSEMVFTTSPFYSWDRWVLLLVYPLLFFAVEGLYRLWKFRPSYKINSKRLGQVPKIITITYLVFLLTLSGFYLTLSSQNQFVYYYYYPNFVPSSMLENTLPISDNPGLFRCFNWINDNTAQNSVVLEQYQLYYWTSLNVNRQVIKLGSPSNSSSQNNTTFDASMVADSEQAPINGSAVYSIWWVKGEGWAVYLPLPSEYQEVYRSGQMAVYAFNATA
jgi:hypothetical protein